MNNVTGGKWDGLWERDEVWQPSTENNVCACVCVYPEKKNTTESDRGNCFGMERNSWRQTDGGQPQKESLHQWCEMVNQRYTCWRYSPAQQKTSDSFYQLNFLLCRVQISIQWAQGHYISASSIAKNWHENSTVAVYFQQSLHAIICLLWKVTGNLKGQSTSKF